jgi:hypothetical protein
MATFAQSDPWLVAYIPQNIKRLQVTVPGFHGFGLVLLIHKYPSATEITMLKLGMS